MRHVTEYSKQELNDMLKELTIQFQEAKKLNLKLNMARGKRSSPVGYEHGPVGVSRGLYAGGRYRCKELRRFRRDS